MQRQLPQSYRLSWFLTDKLLLILHAAGREIGWTTSGVFGVVLKTHSLADESPDTHTQELMLAHSMHRFCPHAVTQYGVWPAVHDWILPVVRAETCVRLGLLECGTWNVLHPHTNLILPLMSPQNLNLPKNPDYLPRSVTPPALSRASKVTRWVADLAFDFQDWTYKCKLNTCQHRSCR